MHHLTHGRPRRRENGHSTPLEIGTKNQKFLEKLKLAAKFRLIDLIVPIRVSIVVITVSFGGMTLTLRQSQAHYSGVMQ